MNGWMDRLLNENADGRAQRKVGAAAIVDREERLTR